jgi:sugar lactone lactonase YvrE
MKKTVWKVLIAALALTTALIACSNPSGEPGGGTPPGGGGPSGEVWVVSTLAGSGTSGYVEGIGAAAEFKYPAGITMGTSGNIYVADSADDRIRTITPSGVVSTLAGNGSSGYADGTGLTAKFYSPHDVAVDSEGIVYVADMSNHRIRKITTPEGVSTLAGSTRGYADGNGTAAKFDYPYGVAVNSEGTVYVADGSNHRIRKITPGGVVTTLAGSGTYGFANGNGTAAKFYSPYGVAVDSAGKVYVADANNHRIRKITPDGVDTSREGCGSWGYADGTGRAAKF